MNDPVEQSIGFGSQGQMVSGASRTYADLFVGGQRFPATASAHNAALQQLYDGGYIGLIGYVLLILLFMRRLARALESQRAASVA